MSAELELQVLLTEAIDEVERTLADCQSKLPATLEPQTAERFDRILEAALRQRDMLIRVRSSTAALPAGQAAPIVKAIVPDLLRDFEDLRHLVDALDTERTAPIVEREMFKLHERLTAEHRWLNVSILGPADVLKPPPPPPTKK